MFRTILFVLSALFLQASAMSQKIYFYGVNSKPLEGLEGAIMTRMLTKKSEKRYLIRTEHLVNGEWMNGIRQKIRIQDEESMLIYEKQPGRFFPRRFYRAITEVRPDSYLFIDATPERVIRKGTSSSYLPLHLEGNVTEFHPDGKVRSESVYRDNQLVFNRNWLPDGSRYIDSVFYSADREPVYKLGEDFFNNYLIQNLRGSGLDLAQVQDEVVIGWVVMEDGSLDGVIALQGKSRQLNQLLIDVITELPGQWEPAILNGSPVRYFISIPLNFMSRDATFQELELSSGRLHYSRY